MFDNWFDIPFEEEELTYDDDGKFHPYYVSMQTDRSKAAPVVLLIWAEDMDSALTCGEVLSAVYLG